MSDQLIFCIPGIWENEKDFQIKIIENTDGKYLPAGKILFNPESQNGIEFDLRGYDERIPDSFKLGSRNTFDKELENKIAKHKSVVYLIVKNDSVDDIKKSFHFVSALLNNGGLAVKIENSGKAHDSSAWSELINRTDLHMVLDLVLMCISSREKKIIYTCGMQLFDLPDCCVKMSSDINYDWHIIFVLASYLLIDKPIIKEEQTFSEKAGSKGYRFLYMESLYDKDSWFYNVHGMWMLNPIEIKRKPFWKLFG